MGVGPRVYGNPRELRSKIDQRAVAGRRLLDRLDAAREVIAARPGEPAASSLRRRVNERVTLEPIHRALSAWERSNIQLLRGYLGATVNAHYGVAKTPELPGTVGPEHLDDMREVVRVRIGELEALGRVLPQRSVPVASDTGPLYDLSVLRASGLFDADVIDGYEARISGLARRAKWRGALAAAKEMVEALNRAVIERLTGQPADKDLKFVRLAKDARNAMQADAASQQLSAISLDASVTLDAALSTLLQALTTLRNDQGEGHGRPRSDPRLARRHVDLAVGCGVVYCRYVVDTMNDLGRLPNP